MLAAEGIVTMVVLIEWFVRCGIIPALVVIKIQISDSDFLLLCSIYNTYNINSTTEITSLKERKNITIHRQNKMCSVTKVA